MYVEQLTLFIIVIEMTSKASWYDTCNTEAGGNQNMA